MLFFMAGKKYKQTTFSFPNKTVDMGAVWHYFIDDVYAMPCDTVFHVRQWRVL